MDHLNRASANCSASPADPPTTETFILDVLSPYCSLQTPRRYCKRSTDGEARRAVGDHGSALTANWIVLAALFAVTQVFEIFDDLGDIFSRRAASCSFADELNGTSLPCRRWFTKRLVRDVETKATQTPISSVLVLKDMLHLRWCRKYILIVGGGVFIHRNNTAGTILPEIRP